MTTTRPLRASDIAELQAIDEVAHGDAWSTAAFGEQIQLDTVRHLVAEGDDCTIVGHAGLWRDGATWRITNVAVAAEAAGNGIATALLLELLADPQDCDRVELEVRPSNRGAQRLYNRFGFAPVGIERGFYDRSDATGSRDALVMAIAEPNSAAWRDRIDTLRQTTTQSTGNQSNRGEAA